MSGAEETRKVLGVLYIVFYMVVAIWAIIFVRTVYKDGVENSVNIIITSTVIVSALSLFALIPTK